MKIFVFILVLFTSGGWSANTYDGIEGKERDFEKYQQGYYINAVGEKVYGLIRYVMGEEARIDYKATESAKREMIYPSECKEFVVGNQTRFVRVQQSFVIKVGAFNTRITNDFIQVLEEGKLGLFYHYSYSGYGTMYSEYEYLLILKDGALVPLHSNLNKRRKELAKIFPGDDEMVEKLSKKKDEEVRRAIQEYNKN